MDHNYKNDWKNVLAAQDQKQALAQHFGFFSGQPELRKLITELFQKLLTAKIQSDQLVIDFEGGFQLKCKAPAENLQPDIPESYGRMAAVHNFMELESPFDVPLTFAGVDEHGKLYGAEFLDGIRQSEFYADLSNHEPEDREILQAMMDGQNEVILVTSKNGANGEPALFYVDHEECEPKGPMSSNLCFSEVFLLLLAERVLDHKLFDTFNATVTEVKIGSESFPLDTEEIDLFQEDLGFLSPQIGLLTKLKSISLCQCKIEGLPAELGQLTALEELELIANDLETLPKEIGYLQNLRKLNLAENKLKTLPSSIGKLTNLRSLDLSYNALEVLPEDIGNLRNLEKLKLEGKTLTSLPVSISSLAHLKELWIFRSAITALPDLLGDLQLLKKLFLIENQSLKGLPESIGRLNNLEILCLNYCSSLSTIPSGIKFLKKLRSFSALKTAIDTISFTHLCKIRSLTSIEITGASITHIPAAIANLTLLEKLNLEGNPIVEIVPEINGLEKLTSLDLDDCKLKNIPAEIGELERLGSFSFTADGIEELPETLARLSNLSFLSMKNVALSTFPAFLFQLPNLRTLSLKRWENLSGIGDEIAHCPSLTGLWIIECRNFQFLSEKIIEVEQFKSILIRKGHNADKILETISRHPNMNEIEIEGCDLSTIPESISKLELLPKLDLANNKITHVPASIANMKKLWSLDLSGNNLTEIAPEIFKIRQLHTLNLSGNPISGIPDEIQTAQNLRKLILSSCDKISGEELDHIKELAPQCDVVLQGDDN